MASLADFLFGLDREQEQERAERLVRLDIAMSQVDYMAIQFVVLQAQVTRMESILMGTGNWDTFNERLNTLIDGYRAAVAMNHVYETQIADADKKTQSAVADAVAKDDEADQDAIDAAADAINAGLTPPDPVVDDVSPNTSEAPPQVQVNTNTSDVSSPETSDQNSDSK